MNLPHVGVGAFRLHMSRPNRWLRRYGLFFDRFEIVDLDDCLHTQRTSGYGKMETLRECDWLIEQGLLRQAKEPPWENRDKDPALAELARLLEEMVVAYDEAEARYKSYLDLAGGLQAVPPAAVSDWEQMMAIANDIAVLRSESAVLSIRSIDRAVSTALDVGRRTDDRVIDVPLDVPGLMRFAIRDLPIPSLATPWEEIEAFKAEEDTKVRLRSLRIWLANTARGGVTLAEAADQISDELGRYRRHLLGAGISYQNATLDALLRMGVAPSSIDIASWTALQAKPFELSQMSAFGRREEEAAPGRELSYLVKVEEAGL